MAEDLQRIEARRIQLVIDRKEKDNFTNHFFSHFGGKMDKQSESRK